MSTYLDASSTAEPEVVVLDDHTDDGAPFDDFQTNKTILLPRAVQAPIGPLEVPPVLLRFLEPSRQPPQPRPPPPAEHATSKPMRRLTHADLLPEKDATAQKVQTWDDASASWVYTKSDGNYGEAMLHALNDLRDGVRKGPLLVKVGGSHDALHHTRTMNQYMYPDEIFELKALRLVSGHTDSAKSAAAEEYCIRWWQDGGLT